MSLRVSNTPPRSPGAGLVRSALTARSPNLRSSSVFCSTTPTWSPNLAAITWSRCPCRPKRRSPWPPCLRNRRRRWWRWWSRRRVCLRCPLSQTRRNPARRRKIQLSRQRSAMFVIYYYKSYYLTEVGCFVSWLQSELKPSFSLGLC